MAIADEFDIFLFDLDGVIYIGSEPLYGAMESLKRLRQAKKGIRFLTNDPCTTKEKTVRKLTSLGIEASEEEVITSSWLTAQYLESENIKSALVLGDENLKWECEQADIYTEARTDVEAVVIGWNDNLSFYDIQKAAALIHRGAKFVATNPDRTFPTPNGPLPAVGAIVEAIRVSTDKRPFIVGKPYPYIFKKALEDFDVSLKAVMIGDNPYTDILGAHQAGIPAILVASQQNKTFPVAKDFRNPDATIANLKGLFDPSIVMKKWTAPTFAWPEAIKAGVAGIIFDSDQRVLLMKRADNGLWGVPSGHVEPGETVEEAIIREIREETGLEVKVNRLIGVYSDPESQVFSYPNGKVSHFITNCFECEVIGGNIVTENEETLDVRYFNINDLPDDLLRMHPKWIKDAIIKQNVSYIR
ncbi:HAD-IIA family hydrolase [Virgibacillus pantothenticus]|uniref:HAD-IIA family hydrolase n=1 Tax=Virgibacillus pantothenticus TaxID=1473 RepID=UPI0009863C89|nr:HAD-IIA family hydrolase [Virgibacillus pantothenticus]